MMSQQHDGDYEIRMTQKQLKMPRKITCKLQQVEKDPTRKI